VKCSEEAVAFVKPDLYEVQFNVDGLMIAGRGNSKAKPQRHKSVGELFK
jgi:hypothetical protein